MGKSSFKSIKISFPIIVMMMISFCETFDRWNCVTQYFRSERSVKGRTIGNFQLTAKMIQTYAERVACWISNNR